MKIAGKARWHAPYSYKIGRAHLGMEGKARKGQRMSEHRRQTYARMLYMHRREFGYTQEQLAALLDESPQTISKIEQGKMVPSFDKLFQIADFFKTTVDAMTGGVGPGRGATTYIDAEFSASDGSMLCIGTQDVEALGKAIDLFVRVRQTRPQAAREPDEGA